MADDKKEEKKKPSKDEIKEILKKSQARDSDDWPVKLKIGINTPFQSLGKYYNMVIEEMGGGAALQKISEYLAASPTSAFYADVAQRKAYAKDQFDKGMGIINNILQTVMKLIYSLREFDQILSIFERLEKGDEKDKIAAELNLRRIFLDEVDLKKGRGSINNLSTTGGLEFVSLRDNFLIIKDLKSIDDLNTNDRVKRILKDRFVEYLNWKKEYKRDIESRRKVQSEYLHSQIESLKLQIDWIKPYYKILKQLNIDTGASSSELVPGLDTSIIKTKLRKVMGGEKEGSLVTAFLDIDFFFKTSPIQVRGPQGQAFHHIFTIEITYTPYVMSNEDYDKIKEVEAIDDADFLEEIAGESIKAIKEDLENFLKGKEITLMKDEKKEEKNEEEVNAFELLFLPFKPMLTLFKKEKKGGKIKFTKWKYDNDFEAYKNKIIKFTNDMYGLFKDENGFPTWSATLA